jgi:hypothetical protein
MGTGFFDWAQVETVLRIYGIPFHQTIHRKLRVCIVEALRIDQEQSKKKKKDKG